MKSIWDSSFKYVPSIHTDVRKTFERLRREQQTVIRKRLVAVRPVDAGGPSPGAAPNRKEAR